MRYYSSVAVDTTLAAPCSAPAVTIVVAGTTGLPVSFPFTLCIDADTINKELVEVTAAAGTSLTVTRGIDGTSAVEHTLGATVSHDHSARDFRESREHENATAVHGATGAVVGTTNTQALTNKDLTSGNTFPSSLATDSEVASSIATEVTNRNTAIGVETTARIAADAGKANVSHTHAEADVTGLVADLAAKAPVSTTATLTTAQSLTHKNLTDATNTFPSTLATVAEVTTATTATGWQTVAFVDPFDSTWDNLSTWFYNVYPGGLIAIRGSAQRNGSSIVADSTGDIATTGIVSMGEDTLFDGSYPLSLPANINIFVNTTNSMWRGRLTTTGAIELLGGSPGATIANNDIVSVNFIYPTTFTP